MSLYSLISSLLSYVFTTIIYLFIFCIIVLIYKDVKRIGKGQDEEPTDENMSEEEEAEFTAILKNVKTGSSSKNNVKSKYRIGEGPILVGRGEDCDIAVSDVYLSQEHFEIYNKDGNWVLRDLKSKNGTYVNDIRVKKPVILDDGDIISFGDVKFLFHPEQ